MERRVVVTGLGAVTPLGIGVPESWKALCAGVSGIARITLFDPSKLRVQIAAEVKGFRAEDHLDKKLVRRTDRYQHFALASSAMAIEDARLEVLPDEAENTGVSIGTTIGGVGSITNAQMLFSNGTSGEMSPFFIPQTMTSMASGQVAMMFGAKGPNFAATTACAASSHAIGDAYRLIQRGDADVMICGGAEAGIIPLMVHGLSLMRAVSSRNDEPQKASRPFDAGRDGFVTGEGGAVLILEEMEHALRRESRIYAEIVGYAANCDSFHVTSPSPGGEGAIRCMRLALKDAGIAPEDVQYINAHGTSTKLNDAVETTAIKTVFGEHARKLAVSSNKSMIGHLWGGSGAVEALFTVLTIAHGVIPPTINYETADPECDLDYVPNLARRNRVDIAISNSFGFGGTNGVLVFRRFQP